MSFIYSLEASWTDAAVTYNGISIDVSDGASGAPIAASGSRLLNLKNNGTSVFNVDVSGNTTSRNIPGDALNAVTLGLVADGNTDNYSVLLNICNTLTGASIYFPPGSYYINMSSGRTSIPLRNIKIFGPPIKGYTGTLTQAIMIIKSNFAAPFEVFSGSAVEDLLWLYADQVDPSSPITYPATLLLDSSVELVSIRRNYVVNAYVFIDATPVTGGFGTTYIEDNKICALSKAINIGLNRETFWIRDNLFTWGAGIDFYTPLGKDTALKTRVRGTTIAINFHGTPHDGANISGNTIFNHYAGIQVDGGLFDLAVINGNIFDSCNFPINVINAGYLYEVSITGNIISAWNDGNASINGICLNLVTVHANPHSFEFTGNYCGAASGGHIVLASSSAVDAVITGNSFNSLGIQQVGGTQATLFVNGSTIDVVFNGNRLNGFNTTTTLGILSASFRSIIATNNRFDSFVKIWDLSGGTDFIGTGNTYRNISDGNIYSLGAITNSHIEFTNTINTYPSGNVTIGTASLSTTATSGFLYISKCAGKPTGVPTAFTGRVPMMYDSTNHTWWVYDTTSSAWLGVDLTAIH